MSRATPQLRTFARHLMTLEAAGKGSAPASVLVAFHMFDKLRPHLATMMGSAGFRALLARALALASAEVAWLRDVQVKANGDLEARDNPKVRPAPKELADGVAALLAQLLGLLVVFIGSALTLRLMSEVWPTLSLDDVQLGDGASE